MSDTEPKIEDADAAPPPDMFHKIMVHKQDLVQLALGGLLILELLFMAFKTLFGELPADLWMVTGLTAILLIILANRQGVTVFVAVLAISTLVAREEFLLEVAAIYRGESLSGIRESRAFEKSELSDDEEKDDVKLQAKLSELLKAGKKDGQTIFKELEAYRDQLDAERDVRRLNDLARLLVTTFAERGSMGSRIFFDLMDDEDIAQDERDLEMSELVGSDYLEYHEIEDWVRLTPKGVLLAKLMGQDAVDQSWPTN